MTKTRAALATAPTIYRIGTAPTAADQSAQVDRSGGRFGAGIIRNAAVITTGEALGHEAWIDEHFALSVGDAINATRAVGLKGRFAHPSMSSDGIGKYVGRWHDAKYDASRGVTVADLHLAEIAHNAPDGDLASYVMDLAEEDGEAFGTSIVFEHDAKAEFEHFIEHGGKVVQGEHGPEWDFSEYASPDPRNTDNLPHVRLSRLRANDIVDSPAANPGGMFHRPDEIWLAAEPFVAYALGQADAKPAGDLLGIDPDRMRGYLARYMETNGITLERPAMSEPDATADPVETDEGTDPAGDETIDATPEELDIEAEADADIIDGQGDDAPADEAPAEEAAADEAPAEAAPVVLSEAQRAEAARYREAFGADGAVWFGEGKTYAQAQELYIAKLKAQNEALRTQAEAGAGEDEPLSSSLADDPDAEKNAAAAKLAANLGSAGLARYALATKLPTN